MHVKYAALHCSYSAPVRVSVVVAARATVAFCGMGMLRGPDTVARGACVAVVARATVPLDCAGAAVDVSRAVTVAAVRAETAVLPPRSVVRIVAPRAETFGAVWVVMAGVDVPDLARTATFPSRVAANKA